MDMSSSINASSLTMTDWIIWPRALVICAALRSSCISYRYLTPTLFLAELSDQMGEKNDGARARRCASPATTADGARDDRSSGGALLPRLVPRLGKPRPGTETTPGMSKTNMHDDPQRHGGRQESTRPITPTTGGGVGTAGRVLTQYERPDPTRRARRRSTSALTPRTRTRRARNSNRRQWFAEGEAGLPSSHSHSEGSRLRGKLKRQWSAEVKQDHASGRSLSVDPVRKNKWKNRPIQSIFWELTGLTKPHESDEDLSQCCASWLADVVSGKWRAAGCCLHLVPVPWDQD